MIQVIKKNWQILFIILTGLAVNLIMLSMHGERGNLFDVKVYINGADYLIDHGEFEDTHHVFYGLHLAIIAVGRLLLPGEIIQVIIFQILLSLFSTVLLYLSAFKLYKNRTAALFSSLFFLFWLDCIHWNTTLMTESLFCSLTIIVIYILVHFKERRTDFLKLGIVLLALCFTRPTAIVILVGVSAFFLSYYRNYLMQQSRLKQFFLLGSFLLVAFFGALFMFQKWDFTNAYMSGEIVTYMSTMVDTPLYQPDLHTPPKNLEKEQIESDFGMFRMVSFILNNPGYFLTMASKKVYYLLSFQRPYYSSWHNAYSFLWLGVVYTCFVMGYKKCSSSSIKAFVLTVIAVNCVLIAMATVDWDNRFFIPIEPGIVLLAGFGAYEIFHKLRSKFIQEKYSKTFSD